MLVHALTRFFFISCERRSCHGARVFAAWVWCVCLVRAHSRGDHCGQWWSRSCSSNCSTNYCVPSQRFLLAFVRLVIVVRGTTLFSCCRVGRSGVCNTCGASGKTSRSHRTLWIISRSSAGWRSAAVAVRVRACLRVWVVGCVTLFGWMALGGSCCVRARLHVWVLGCALWCVSVVGR